MLGGEQLTLQVRWTGTLVEVETRFQRILVGTMFAGEGGAGDGSGALHSLLLLGI